MQDWVVFQRRWERFFLRWAVVIIPSVYGFYVVVQYFFTWELMGPLLNRAV